MQLNDSSDVTLICEDKSRFKTSMSVLIACSPVRVWKELRLNQTVTKNFMEERNYIETKIFSYQNESI